VGWGDGVEDPLYEGRKEEEPLVKKRENPNCAVPLLVSVLETPPAEDPSTFMDHLVVHFIAYIYIYIKSLSQRTKTGDSPTSQG